MAVGSRSCRGAFAADGSGLLGRGMGLGRRGASVDRGVRGQTVVASSADTDRSALGFGAGGDAGIGVDMGRRGQVTDDGGLAVPELPEGCRLPLRRRPRVHPGQLRGRGYRAAAGGAGVSEILVAATSKRRRYGSYMGEISPAPDNLLNRDFSASAPNEKWLTDITEFQIPAGKVYLSPMIDCFDGMVVSWSIGTRPNAELVNTMLDAAIDTVAISAERPVVHSDRGGHYRWPGWLSRIAGAKLIRSMSRKGCSPDNAACEGFFGRLKIEMFFERDWLFTTVEEFVAALDAYIRWYNETRIKISLGGLSPAAHRRSLGIAV